MVELGHTAQLGSTVGGDIEGKTMSDTSATAKLPTAPAVVREQPGGPTMRAIVLEKFGGLDSLVYTEIPKPLPRDGEVVIAIKAFGINHAELRTRVYSA
jgi:NADPH:quinone reductase